MRVLVTGAAGFIGSHTVELLHDEGHDVLAVDAFLDNYDPERKRRTASSLGLRSGATCIETDLALADADALLAEVDAVVHLAAQPGVRGSWGRDFTRYTVNNVEVTQRLLDAAVRHPVARFVYASSSSVYGDQARYPVRETDTPRPRSPYGVTKLAAEHLCGLYAATHGVPTVSLRYFTVYGPRQRPDMALYRLFEALRADEPFPLYGDGEQVRDFTSVGDVARANLLALTRDVAPGTVVNIAGGAGVSMNQVIAMAADRAGRQPVIDARPAAAGDVRRTGADASAAARLLGWGPSVGLRDGLAEQFAWHEAEAVSVR